jgi:hypothetical protein
LTICKRNSLTWNELIFYLCKTNLSLTLPRNFNALHLQTNVFNSANELDCSEPATISSTQTNWVFNEIRGLVENLPSCQLKGRTIDGLNGIRVTETSLL